MTQADVQRRIRTAMTRPELEACRDLIAAWMDEHPDDAVVAIEAESVEMALSALDILEQ